MEAQTNKTFTIADLQKVFDEQNPPPEQVIYISADLENKMKELLVKVSTDMLTANKKQ